MITGELRSKVDAIWLEIFSAGSKASQYKHAHIVFFWRLLTNLGTLHPRSNNRWLYSGDAAIKCSYRLPYRAWATWSWRADMLPSAIFVVLKKSNGCVWRFFWRARTGNIVIESSEWYLVGDVGQKINWLIYLCCIGIRNLCTRQWIKSHAGRSLVTQSRRSRLAGTKNAKD